MRVELLERYYACELTPVERFQHVVRSLLERPYVAGIVLVLCTIIALAWANSPWGDTYAALFYTHFVVGYGDIALSKPLVFWINDGLMAIFFFLVGLEVKREILEGELSTWQKAALPVVAAIGGMLFPALIFTAFNYGQPTLRGWAIPAATDIAFAVGILSLLGHRVPHSLRIFLLSLAIADDIGAVLIIAAFYTADLSFGALAVGAVGLGVLWGFNRLRIYNLAVYAVVGVVIWMAFLKSGVHPTVAGVLTALTVPLQPRMPWERFWRGTLQLLSESTYQDGMPKTYVMTLVEHVERASIQAMSPLQRAIHGLHMWVTYAIMPLFALANAGVRVEVEQIGMLLASPVLWGVALGLFLGKQLGVFGFSYLLTRLGVAKLPTGVRWSHVYGVSLLAGIGFTMALFIAGLAYGDSLLTLDEAKLGVLLGSALSAVVGTAVLWRVLPRLEAIQGEGALENAVK
ncbi:MAG: Na+/H+ antiporter NhaA [Candidatus Kapabacteria bacterium]|nr:Na+/H+ antiporter NhaA [Candidatus Kapabacteria bacterium]MDW8011877.1 Na+/H+ antiporter NhaA [Bacteroidota bacterium]